MSEVRRVPPPAAGKPPSTAENALLALQQLADDYETRLLKTLYDFAAQRPRLGAHLPAQLAFTAVATGGGSSGARQQLADKFTEKLLQFFGNWQRELDKRAGGGAAGAAASAAQHVFQTQAQQFMPLLPVLEHSRDSDPLTGAAVLSVPAAKVARVTKGTVEALIPLLQRGQLSFPWKRLFVSEARADEMMANLRVHTAVTKTTFVTPHNVRFSSALLPLTYEGGYLSIVHGDDDYNRMDLLVDLFQEEARLSARRQDQDASPLQLWRTRPEVVRQTLERALHDYQRLDALALRESFVKCVKECTQFKPSLVVDVIRLFGARRMLDISAGWGDRLAGAIAADLERYLAFDPNTALKAGHDRLRERFVPDPARRADFHITYTGFEQAELPANAFDLLFTSPPFFDFEIYTDRPGQSVDTYRGLDTWTVRFLMLCLSKAWRALQPDGHVVIHITDVFKTRVCERMCLLMLWLLPGIRYQGVINSFGAAGRPRPMWCFHKLPDPRPDPELQQRARADLGRLYASTLAEAEAWLKEGGAQI